MDDLDEAHRRAMRAIANAEQIILPPLVDLLLAAGYGETAAFDLLVEAVDRACHRSRGKM